MTAADEELHEVPRPKRFSTPGIAEALTLEDYKRITEGMDRHLTDEPIQRRRGTAGRNQITASTFGDFI